MRSVTSCYHGSKKPTTPATARRTAKNNAQLSPEDEVDSGEIYHDAKRRGIYRAL